MKLKTSHVVAFFFVAIAFSALGGYLIGTEKQISRVKEYFENTNPINKRDYPYDFISSSVGSDSLPATSIGLYTNGYSKLKSIIDSHLEDGSLSDVSLYYRDLKSLGWFGYREDESFVPASLLKLIFALAVYKQEEAAPGFLTKKIQFTQAVYDVASKRGSVDTKLILNQWYSMQDLVEDMMINSDNSARDLISTAVDERYIDELYSIVDVHTPEARKEYQISAKDYSLFLRILYNSKFINEEHSNALLAIMAKSSFTGGLVGGVDAAIPIAHKFGVYTFTDGTNSNKVVQEIHDCGIIYYPNEPYLLCVMTKGENQDTLASIIREISKSVYDSHTREDL